MKRSKLKMHLRATSPSCVSDLLSSFIDLLTSSALESNSSTVSFDRSLGVSFEGSMQSAAVDRGEVRFR